MKFNFTPRAFRQLISIGVYKCNMWLRCCKLIGTNSYELLKNFTMLINLKLKSTELKWVKYPNIFNVTWHVSLQSQKQSEFIQQWNWKTCRFRKYKTSSQLSPKTMSLGIAGTIFGAQLMFEWSGSELFHESLFSFKTTRTMWYTDR